MKIFRKGLFGKLSNIVCSKSLLDFFLKKRNNFEKKKKSSKKKKIVQKKNHFLAHNHLEYKFLISENKYQFLYPKFEVFEGDRKQKGEHFWDIQ